MSVEQKAIVTPYIHWSKNPAFIGATEDLKNHPPVSLDTKRFKKSGEDRAIEFSEKLKYKNEMIKKYGIDWKNFMQKNKLMN